ncbi:MAG: AIM24 family protein [Muribaculaceae bacterium]|nr:AIM24 family protein [Muribaculaceae bacterium]MDE6768347.1 AIM24 family protein [Muribaculaceae bacterium]MDE6794249.1 AIM24 family protein [Muribaculaceae bacterium]
MNVKLVGQFIQHLEVTLMSGENFFAEKGSIIYLEAGIEKDRSLSGSGLGRLIGAKLSGENFFILRLYNNTNIPRKVVLGSRYGLLPVKLNGETMICHRGVYVASNNQVNISTKLSIAGLTGGMGLLLQKISGNSTVFLDTKGTPITINLQYGETIEVDEDHIIALHNIADHQMQSNWSLGNLLGGEGFSMMRITGPGTVYLSPSKFNEFSPVNS